MDPETELYVLRESLKLKNDTNLGDQSRRYPDRRRWTLRGRTPADKPYPPRVHRRAARSE